MNPVAAPVSIDFILIIVTAAVLGLIARKFNQPTIIAYIFTGVVLGPVIFNVVNETNLISLMSELGLGFLLFLLGIEMNIDEIREIVKPVTYIAIGQTILQTALAFIIPYFLGFTLLQTTVIALCTVFGATPVIVKTLADKDELSTLPGKIDVGVLILQDIYLIIILALFSSGTLTNPAEIGWTLARILVLITAIGLASFTASKYVLPRVFSHVADNRHGFFIHGIAWAFLFITVANWLGLSVEVGAFLAGLGLGRIPYRDELKERIRPLTDFFMVIFFSSIALRLNAENLLVYWQEAILASIGLMIGNFLIMFFLIDWQNFTPRTSFIGSINMTQVSEFSLVVGALAVSQGYIGNEILGYLSLMALLTMTVSTYLINYNSQIYERIEHLLERLNSEEKIEPEIKTLEGHAVIIGYNEMVKSVLPALKEEYGDIVVVDRNSNNTGELGKSGYEYIYGDFKHGEIRKASAVKNADFVLSVSNELPVNRKLVEESPRDATKFVKATEMEEAAELYDLGAHYVIQKNVLTGEKMSEYIKLYLEDRELFLDEVELEKEKLIWGGKSV
jgi:Kef-type K+ transport system membrane component KefB